MGIIEIMTCDFLIRRSFSFGEDVLFPSCFNLLLKIRVFLEYGEVLLLHIIIIISAIFIVDNNC